jgi:hypothetical protein
MAIRALLKKISNQGVKMLIWARNSRCNAKKGEKARERIPMRGKHVFLLPAASKLIPDMSVLPGVLYLS